MVDVKVTYKPATEKREVQIKEPVFQLNLNAEEAILLLGLTGNLLGSGEVRKVANNIYAALNEGGWTLSRHF